MEKTLTYLAYVFLSLTLIDLIDFSLRLIAGSLGILLTIYLIKRARNGIAVDKLNRQIKEQELKSLMDHNSKTSDPEE